jgi:catechol 2,3-dioxygenase
MPPLPRPRFSHIGFHVRDLDAMVAFYTELLGLEVTDRGRLNVPGNPRIAFLSSKPDEHHQIALVEGRGADGDGPPVIQQISFRVDSLAEVRELKAAAEARGIRRFLPLNHGNAWSVYFPDPEGNGIEIFTASRWHVHQPVTDGLDLSQSDAEVAEATRRRYEGAQDFQPAAAWREAFAKRLEERWGS